MSGATIEPADEPTEQTGAPSCHPVDGSAAKAMVARSYARSLSGQDVEGIACINDQSAQPTKKTKSIEKGADQF
jgi:hypothetical protein